MKKKLNVGVIFIIVIGIALSITLAILENDYERANINKEFKNSIDLQVESIRKELSLNLQVLESLNGLFRASKVVERYEFKAFASPMLKAHSTIQALEWIPRVPDSKRILFERDAKEAGFLNFQFTERKKQGSMERAGIRKEYYPVYFVEPLTSNKAALGFDLASSEKRKNTLDESLISGKMLATEPITLVQETAKQKGFLAFYPFYKGEPGNIAERKENIRGFVLGVFRLESIIKKSLAKFIGKDNLIDMNIKDLSAPVSNRFIYGLLNESGTITLLKEMRYVKKIEVAGRTWEINSVPTKEYFDAKKSINSYLIFLSGLTITTLLAGYFYITSSHTREVEVKVKLQTRSLKILQETVNTANESENVDAAIQIYLDSICNYSDWSVGHTYTVEETGNLIPGNLWFISENLKYDSFRKKTMNISFEPGKGLPGRVYESGKPLWITDINKDEDFIRLNNEEDLYIRSAFGFPVRIDKKIEIVLEFFSEHTKEIDFDIIDIITHLTVQLGRVIERKKYREDLENTLAISERHKLQALKAKEKAEESNRLKSDFLNTMSHELRTPLTIIIGNNDLLVNVNELPDIEEIVEISQDIGKSSKHLLTLINDLLDISKIDAGKCILSYQTISANSIIFETAESVRLLADKKGLTLNVKNDEKFEFEADPIRIKQILFNLLSNAIKFTDKGEIVVSSYKANGFAKFEIKDTGCGMDKFGLDIIFDPFRQIDGSITRKAGGTGLGLAITEKLTKLHGGDIEVKSELGKGTTFMFSIPINGKSAGIC